jgi:enoyl-CoA hydratase
MTGEVVVDRIGGVTTITLSNPQRRNAITLAMYDRFEAVCAEIAADPDARVVVLRGADGNFAGGTDIADLVDISSGEAGVEYESHIARVQQSLLNLRVPIIAVVEGVCVGGGLVFAAISDLVYATPDARFGSPIARTLGNTLSAASLARLYSTFGRRRTNQMLMTATLFTAQQAHEAGFLNAIVQPDALAATIDDVTSAINSCAPASIRSFKEFERRIDRALAEIPTADVFAEVYGSNDFRVGVEAFLGKRRAEFTGS